MGQFHFTQLDIPGLYLIEPRIFGDARGYFMETYNHDDFKAAGIPEVFVQDNQSKSSRGVLGGLHFQRRHPQGKLVRVVAGEVFDVAVDIRPASPTYGRWAGVTLSAENKKQFYLPPGFAHGFLVLSETAEFVYKCTDYYHPEDEDGVIWNDPQISIAWPLAGLTVVLSDKDARLKRLEA